MSRDHVEWPAARVCLLRPGGSMRVAVWSRNGPEATSAQPTLPQAQPLAVASAATLTVSPVQRWGPWLSAVRSPFFHL